MSRTSQNYAKQFLMVKRSCFLTVNVIMLILMFCSGNVFAGDATLTWNLPTTNVDGTPLTDLSGYNVDNGIESSMHTQVADTGLITIPAAPQYTVTNLTEGSIHYENFA